MFAGRKVVIASKHRKEKVIGPVLEAALGVICTVPEQLDTDLLGTFSGEINRELDPIQCAKEKCLLAIAQSGCDIAVSSEGSFGPHPYLHFVPADEEILFFLDLKNNIEITARVVSTETNFSAATVSLRMELDSFLREVQFPSHAVILRKSQNDFDSMHKGIVDHQVLLDLFGVLVSKHGSAYIETDMRAMHNPSRMKIIQEATELLVKKINTVCPQCAFPGFEVVDAVKGLPCAQCKFPTQSTHYTISKCKKCTYTSENYFPKNKKVEEPTYCDVCNP
jgi:hypothetical protein